MSVVSRAIKEEGLRDSEIGLLGGVRLALKCEFAIDRVFAGTAHGEVMHKKSIADARRRVLDAVFGEFVGPLEDLHSALAIGDTRRACRLVGDIYDTMFADVEGEQK